MQPYMLNRKLYKKWSDHENLIMSKKLTNVKPAINSFCPESFVYSKNLKKPKVENS